MLAPKYDVTVIIPCYNAGAFLLESVASALAQLGSFTLRETIVVDDRSDDARTREILATLQSNPQVRVLVNEGAKGSAASRNTGIRHAQSSWVAFLDADDWWPPDSLHKRFCALEQFPDAQWVGGDFIEKVEGGSFQKRGRFERNLATYHFLSQAYQGSRSPIRLKRPLTHFLEQAPTHTIVTLVRKELVERVGGFDERLLRQQDYHLFLRLAAAADYIFVPEVVAFYRVHERNSTRSLTHTQQWRIKALRDLATRADFTPLRSELKRHIAQLYFGNSLEFRRQGDFRLAILSAVCAMWTQPLSATYWKALAASTLRLR